PYWIGGLILSALVPVLAWDQTSSVLQKALIATGLPILLLFSSIWVAGRKAWEAERGDRNKVEAKLRALESRQLTVEFTPLANNGSEWISRDSRLIQYRARIINNSPQTIHGCGGQINKIIRKEDEGLADGY